MKPRIASRSSRGYARVGIRIAAFPLHVAPCARAYLDSEDDFSYVPYGLDVFGQRSRDVRQPTG